MAVARTDHVETGPCGQPALKRVIGPKLLLVGRYPRAAGAALYTNRAFRIPFLTFMVAFAVMSSGITSSSASD
jgi:APA family basic amino acid/polyamine antiporter